MASKGNAVDSNHVQSVAEQSGLIIFVGHLQRVAAMHDSIADYLAARAHVFDIVALPDVLRPGDTERVAFFVERAGVDEKIALSMARSVPFALVRLAQFDKGGFDEASPGAVAALLALLQPDLTRSMHIALWRHEGQTIASLPDSEIALNEWISAKNGLGMLMATDTVVVTGGPLRAATQIWRYRMKMILSAAYKSAQIRLAPTRLPEVVEALDRHTRSTRTIIAALIDQIAPPEGRGDLIRAVGPTGIEAVISRQDSDSLPVCWHLRYQASDQIRITSGNAGAPQGSESAASWGLGWAEWILDRSPEETAIGKVSKAVNELAGSRWL
jgi:hypothetical protein